MAKHSLKLLFLRKYRTGKKIYRHLKLSSANSTIGNCDKSSDSRASIHHHHVKRNFTREQGSNRLTRSNNNSSVDSVDCCLLICDCIAQNKLRTFVFLVIIGLFSTTGLYFYNQSLQQYRVTKTDVFSPKHGIRLKRCSLPNLKPFSSAVRPFIIYNSRPNCANEQKHSFSQFPPYTLKNGSYLVRNIDKTQADGCCYRPFTRNGENNVGKSKTCQDISNNEVTKISPSVEYIELLCINSATETDYRDGFALIPRKEMVEDRVATFEETFSGPPRDFLSVVILGLDATSRMNFIRAMPKSNKYLLKTLSAISLNGYTKVAENTLPNVVPLLTGRTLEEFKQECVDEKATPAKVRLDKCPFIWKIFAANGYRTSLAEDDINIGIFNMNWAHAFSKPPTDYYLRPFSVLMQKHHSFRNGYCYGSSLSFEKLLENVRSMAEVFHKKPYFQFLWSTKLSHDDFNKLKWGDEHLLSLLKVFRSNSYLNNTALLIIGDHGSRLDKIRSTDQGKIEDRMPVAYIVLPNWFKKKYKKSHDNLRQNSDRITSAFDVHKTLYEFMNLNNLERFENNKETETSEIIKLSNNETVLLNHFRGLSLFQKLPQNRTCFAAGIPLHWCVCHKKIPQDTNSEIVKNAADFIVTSINILLQGYGSCATLTLQSIDEVSKWDPSEIIREDCETTPTVDRNDVNYSSKAAPCNTSDVTVLQIAFTVNPSDATFETTVIQMKDGKWRTTEHAVRTNAYEGQSHCVEQKLKPYCFCTGNESIFGGFF